MGPRPGLTATAPPWRRGPLPVRAVDVAVAVTVGAVVAAGARLTGAASSGRAGPVVAYLLGGGHGIEGMRERALAVGGRLDAGPVAGGGFRVSGRLPFQEMDVRMPGVDGLEATRRIASNDDLAGVRVLMLTTFDHDEYVFEALRAGASGFLVKDTDPAELLHAVRWSPAARRCCRRG